MSAYGRRVGFITALGLAGRLLFLGFQPLWRDEAFTAVVVTRPWAQMFDAVRADSAPPLLYVLDHLIASQSSSPFALRLVPAITGAGAIPIAAALGRRIGGNRAGIITALLVAFAPAFVLSARDARMYALASMLVLASTLLLWRAVERPAWSRWLAYAGVTVLAVYSDYFALLALVAQGVAVLFVLHPPLRTTAAAAVSAVVAALTLAPWLLAAHAQASHAGEGFWVPPLGFASTSGTFVQFFSGPPVDPWVPGKPVLQSLQGLTVLAGLVAISALFVWHRRLGSQARRGVFYCTTCGLGALLLLVLISIWQPLLDGRYASVVWGPLFPVLGAGLALIPMRQVIVAALAANVAASAALSVAATHPATQSAIAMIRAQLGSDDLVDTYPSQYLLFIYYDDPAVMSHTRVLSSAVPWFWGTAAFQPGAIISTVPADVVGNHGRVFFVGQPDESASLIPSLYGEQSRQCWTGVCVTVYAPASAA